MRILKRNGYTYSRISKETGVPTSTVADWCADLRNYESYSEGTCEVCGEDFTAIRNHKRFCSEECKKASYNPSRRQKSTRYREALRWALDNVNPSAQFSDEFIEASKLAWPNGRVLPE